MKQIFVMLILSLAAPFAIAQDAAVTGFVLDQTNAVVPQATVTLSNLLTGVVSTTKSNGEGLFTFEGVQPGTYTAKAEHTGFKASEVSNIGLHVADRISIDFKLQVGPTSQVVTVSGNDLSLSTSPAVSTVIDRQLIENMPLNGRSLETLFELTPGVVRNAGGGPANGGGSR